MQDEAFGFDFLSTLVDVGCDMDLETRLARSAGHRQAIEQERIVLANDVKHASRGAGVRGGHSIIRVPNSKLGRSKSLAGRAGLGQYPYAISIGLAAKYRPAFLK